MKTLKKIATVACVAALAVPAAVLAKGPNNGDHGNHQHGKNTKPHHVSAKCKKPLVGFTLHGTLADGSTAQSLNVTVKRANKHARKFVVNGVFPVDTTGVKVKYVGDNPFTTPGAELHFKDWKVVVVGKVLKTKKRCDADNSILPQIRKVMVIGPGSGESGSNETGSNNT
ncbi:MAG TPA: hypothetical protein VF066_17515 [Thermoleophilaceae bacterium]